MLLSTHVLSEVRQSCSRLLIINRGRIVADGAVETLMHRAAGAVQLSVEAKGDRVLERLAALPGVARVEPDGGTAGTRAVLTVSGDQDLRPVVFDLAKREQWTLYELHQEQASLEDLIPRENTLVFTAPGPVDELLVENSWRLNAAEVIREQVINLSLIHI